MRVLNKIIVLAALVGAGTLGAGSDGQAGELHLQVHFTNMTPDEHSSESSKRCAAKVRGALVHDGVTVKFMGETALRKKLGEQDKSKNFMAWTPKANVALVAVDCRPEQKLVDILLLGTPNIKTTIRLRDQEISARRLNWLTKDAVRHVWGSFGGGY
jgi:hypothetical protein